MSSHTTELQSCLIICPRLLGLKSAVKKIRAAAATSYAITSKFVYCWGQKQFKQDDGNTIPIEVDDLAAGSNHAFAWRGNSVYCWGSNADYQLGLQQEIPYSCQKVQMFEEACSAGYTLLQISCGDKHTLATFSCEGSNNEGSLLIQEIAEDEKNKSPTQLFSWGASQSFQLALNTNKIVPYPVLTPCSIAHFETMASKSDYNAIICKGEIFTWGGNIFSRLGLQNPVTVPHIQIPRKVSLPNKIISVGLGTYHVMAVAVSGEAYSWGKGNQGQLGTGRLVAEGLPTKVICEEEIAEASCGQNHSLVLLRDGRLKSCGSNALGHAHFDPKEKKKRCLKLQFIELDGCTGIACGDKHSLALDSKGRVWAWGSNDQEQAVPNKINEPEHRKQRKQLELIIENRSFELRELAEEGGLGQEVRQWREKYRRFQERVRVEQEQILSQLDQIVRKAKGRP